MGEWQASAAHGPSVTEDDCRDLYRKLTSGVAVITASGLEGPVGMTASAVTSLSLRPPLIIACFSHGSITLREVQRSGQFGLHMLRDDQQHVAESFARAGGSHEKFTEVRADTSGPIPVLADALAWATCAVEQVLNGGDHTLLIGRVVASRVGVGNPLVWHHSGYRQISDPIVMTLIA